MAPKGRRAGELGRKLDWPSQVDKCTLFSFDSLNVSWLCSQNSIDATKRKNAKHSRVSVLSSHPSSPQDTSCKNTKRVHTHNVTVTADVVWTCSTVIYVVAP